MINSHSLSDEQLAVLKYALDNYEEFVDGDRTNNFITAFYDLKTNLDDEYRSRELDYKVFYKYEP